MVAIARWSLLIADGFARHPLRSSPMIPLPPTIHTNSCSSEATTPSNDACRLLHFPIQIQPHKHSMPPPFHSLMSHIPYPFPFHHPKTLPSLLPLRPHPSLISSGAHRLSLNTSAPNELQHESEPYSTPRHVAAPRRTSPHIISPHLVTRPTPLSRSIPIPKLHSRQHSNCCDDLTSQWCTSPSLTSPRPSLPSYSRIPIPSSHSSEACLSRLRDSRSHTCINPPMDHVVRRHSPFLGGFSTESWLSTLDPERLAPTLQAMHTSVQPTQPLHTAHGPCHL